MMQPLFPLQPFIKTLIFSFGECIALFSRSVMFNSSRPHGLQHARLPCPSPTPRVYSNSCPLSQWCHPTISSPVIPFSFCLQSFSASGSFQMSQLFTSGSQSIGVSKCSYWCEEHPNEYQFQPGCYILTSSVFIISFNPLSRSLHYLCLHYWVLLYTGSVCVAHFTFCLNTIKICLK